MSWPQLATVQYNVQLSLTQKPVRSWSLHCLYNVSNTTLHIVLGNQESPWDQSRTWVLLAASQSGTPNTHSTVSAIHKHCRSLCLSAPHTVDTCCRLPRPLTTPQWTWQESCGLFQTQSPFLIPWCVILKWFNFETEKRHVQQSAKHAGQHAGERGSCKCDNTHARLSITLWFWSVSQ